MEYKIFAAHLNGQIEHFTQALQSCQTHAAMAIHQGDIRWPVETKPDSMALETLRNSASFVGTYSLGKILTVIQSNLHQAETVAGGELFHLVERSAYGKTGESKTTFENAADLRHQVFLSFFLAAGNRTLFKISL
jgi:hypothetical protein